MQLNEKLKTFSQIFTAVLQHAIKLKYFEKKMSPIAPVILKLLTLKDVLTKMHKRSYFGKPFGSERVNESQKLLISAESTLILLFHHLQQTRVSCFVRSDILGLLVNTLTVNYEYSRSNRDNLPLPTQMQLWEKLDTFSKLLLNFLESTLNFKHFEKRNKKMNLIGQVS